MTTTATRELLVIVNEQGQHVCVAADRFHCLAQRYGDSIDFARCMDGCQCGCHAEKNGAEIAAGIWERVFGEKL